MYEDLIKSAEKTSLQVISSAEKRIGVKFPDSFRVFSLEKDGAHFKNAEIKANRLHARQSSYGVRRILPVRKIGASRVENWDDRLIAFAEDSSGNYFVFTKSEMGRVYFWDHETDEVELVSNSFTDFLDSIKRADCGDVPTPINSKVWVNPAFLKKIKDEKK